MQINLKLMIKKYRAPIIGGIITASSVLYYTIWKFNKYVQEVDSHSYYHYMGYYSDKDCAYCAKRIDFLYTNDIPIVGLIKVLIAFAIGFGIVYVYKNEKAKREIRKILDGVMDNLVKYKEVIKKDIIKKE